MNKEVEGKNRPRHEDGVSISSQNIIKGKGDNTEVDDKKYPPE